MTSNNKPLVAMACLCEKVLNEADGVLSVIRIVDSFTVAAAPAVMEHFAPQLVFTFVLGLKANGLTGKHEISIQLAGETKSEQPMTRTFEFPEGPLGAVNVVTQVAIGVVKNYGNKRFDVFFDGELLTSVPFRVLQGPAPAQVSSEASQ